MIAFDGQGMILGYFDQPVTIVQGQNEVALDSLEPGEPPPLVPPGPAPRLDFVGARSVPMQNGLGARGVGAGDFNGDGVADLAASADSFPGGPGDSGQQRVEVFLGTGNLDYNRGAVLVTESTRWPYDVAAADFDGDGLADLAVALSDGVRVFRATGGSFSTAFDAQLPNFPDVRKLAVADLDRNGRPDLVVGDRSGPVVAVLLNQGGSFQGPDLYPVRGAHNLAVGDVDSDGRPDVAAGNAEHVDLLLSGQGTSAGRFGSARPVLDRSSGGLSLALGDLDRDGHLDLLAEGAMRGAGDGTFSTFLAFYPISDWLGLGDLDGDRILDLVGSAFESSAQTFAMKGAGDGTLTTLLELPAGDTPYQVTIADLDGDGLADAAVAAEGALLLHAGDRATLVERPVVLPLGFSPGPGHGGDFDGDGRPDLLITDPEGPDSVVFLQNSVGDFVEASQVGGSWMPAEVTGDGVLDLVGASFGGPWVSSAEGQGDGTFVLLPQTHSGLEDVFKVAVGGLSGDGLADVAAYGRLPGQSQLVLRVLRARAGGGFDLLDPVATQTTSLEPSDMLITDMDGDGRADLLVADQEGLIVRLLLGTGGGGLQVGPAVAIRNDGVAHLVAADFDGDGRKDLAVGQAGGVLILRNTGSGFLPQPLRATSHALASLGGGDLNGDHRPDLAYASASTVSILLGRGDGTFEPEESFLPGSRVGGIRDFNRDGLLDLFALDAPGRKAYVVNQR